MAKRIQCKKTVLRRTHKFVLTLNDEEAQALDFYVSKYRRKTQTKASIIRELIMSQVIQRCESDVEMLFPEEDMR